jgi:hypothetical protein
LGVAALLLVMTGIEVSLLPFVLAVHVEPAWILAGAAASVSLWGVLGNFVYTRSPSPWSSATWSGG